jgi:hypothetical protein
MELPQRWTELLSELTLRRMPEGITMIEFSHLFSFLFHLRVVVFHPKGDRLWWKDKTLYENNL